MGIQNPQILPIVPYVMFDLSWNVDKKLFTYFPTFL